MHELSLAQDIVEIVKQNILPEELHLIESIKLKVGDFAGVVADSLEFSFEAITSGTEMEDAKLDIERVPFQLKCNDCGGITSNEFGIMICEECSGSRTEIISGTEMKVIEVVLKEVPEAVSRAETI